MDEIVKLGVGNLAEATRKDLCVGSPETLPHPVSHWMARGCLKAPLEYTWGAFAGEQEISAANIVDLLEDMVTVPRCSRTIPVKEVTPKWHKTTLTVLTVPFVRNLGREEWNWLTCAPWHVRPQLEDSKAEGWHDLKTCWLPDLLVEVGCQLGASARCALCRLVLAFSQRGGWVLENGPGVLLLLIAFPLKSGTSCILFSKVVTKSGIKERRNRLYLCMEKWQGPRRAGRTRDTTVAIFGKYNPLSLVLPHLWMKKER